MMAMQRAQQRMDQRQGENAGSSYEGLDHEGSYLSGMLPFGKAAGAGGADGAGSAAD